MKKVESLMDRFKMRFVVLAIMVVFCVTIDASADAELDSVKRELSLLKQKVDEMAAQRQSAQGELYSALGKLKFAGYGEVHANFTEGTESDKVDFHRLVLYVGYNFADWIRFHSETELEHAFVNDNDTEDGGSASGGELSIEQAYVDFLLFDSFNIRAGRILTPLGIINQTHEPTLFNGVERPNFSKRIIPTTWSSDGVGAFGSLTPELSYEAYVVAGLDGDSFDASGIRGGRIKSMQSLNEVAFTTRLDYRPFTDQDLRLGVSGYYGGLDNKDGGGGTGKNAEIAMTSGDFEYSISKFDFRGVVAVTEITGARELGDSVADEMFGWYIEGAYHFMPDACKTGKLKDADAVFFVRYEEYDTQHKMPSGIDRVAGKDKEELTLGVNFYLTSNFVVKADYQFINDDGAKDADDLFNLGLGWTF